MSVYLVDSTDGVVPRRELNVWLGSWHSLGVAVKVRVTCSGVTSARIGLESATTILRELLDLCETCMTDNRDVNASH